MSSFDEMSAFCRELLNIQSCVVCPLAFGSLKEITVSENRNTNVACSLKALLVQNFKVNFLKIMPGGDTTIAF